MSRCTDFKNFHFMAQRAKSEETWDYYELKTGHDVMIIVPNDLYDYYCKYCLSNWSR